jgi:imidazole glycerol-phosphate synthase subunit HisF
MIKTRLIPTMLYKDFTLVKGVRFDSWRRVGSLIQQVKVYSLRGVDELIFLDINARNNSSPDYPLIDDFSDDCFLPLTVGGGVKNHEAVGHLLRSGADKVAINSAATQNLKIIEDSAKRFGSQAIVLSIDAKRDQNGRYTIFSHSGTKHTGLEPVTFAKDAENAGAGEILITSIDRDGTMQGYDIELVRLITDAVSIPVIASGGAGKPKDFLDALLDGGASAVAAASIFHFTQTTPLEIKQYLKANNINVRI